MLGAVSAAREAREAAEWRRRLFEEATGDAAPYEDFLDLEHKDTGSAVCNDVMRKRSLCCKSGWGGRVAA